MKILHLTDLHFTSNSYQKVTQHNVIESLINYLEKINDTVDLVIFSGDLVYKGNEYKDFIEANEQFLQRVSGALNLPSDNIILCPGNHDMNRDFKSGALEKMFEEEIISNDKLYDFFIKNDNDLANSLKTTENYNSFLKNFYKNNTQTIIEELYCIHKRKIGEKEIAIISINSAWRSVDDTSNGKLLFPTHLLEDALYESRNINCKFMVLHHPIHWFRDYNQGKLQELIYRNCDIMFSGHIHESEITTHYKQNNGIFAHVSPASLTYDKSFIGFSSIDFCPDDKNIAHVQKHHFNTEKGSFEFIDNIEVNIPTGEQKAEQNRIREKISAKLIPELLNSKDLLLDNEDDENDNLFLDRFNTPKIRLKPKQEIKESISKETENFNFETLLKNKKNYFIYGYDKSGKTSLLKYVQIYHLKYYSKNGNIPFYIDFKEIDSKEILDEIRKYYGLSKEKTKELILNHNFRLLIDNFDINHLFFEKLEKFLEEYPNVNFIITCDYLTSRLYNDYTIDHKNYKKLYLHDISRKDVRTHIEKSQIIPKESTDEVLDKIINFCKQIELPLSYWTISLIIMIHKKSKFDISKNIYSLLDLCVDEILQKKFRVLKNSKVSYDQLKIICAHLANFLLYNNSENNYSKKYSDVINELENYIENNDRIKASSKEIVEYLINCGVLKMKEDDRISFRLNGIFEFFIAVHMSENKEFLEEVLNDNLYLSFKNEFEIYSGIKNEDEKFLKKIYKKTKKYFKPVNQNFREIGESDLILISKVSDKNDANLKKIINQLNIVQPLDDDKKDLIKDQHQAININSEIIVKKTYDVGHLDIEVYERYISILARIFKTMDGVTDPVLLSKVLDFLLETYINFGFYLIDEINNDLEIEEGNEAANLLELVGKFLPLISQINMTDNIAQHNIEKVIIRKINDLKKESKTNQYRLFILYFILMDIDEENIFNYADDVIELIDIGVLKYSMVLKLNYYHAFSNNSNKKLKQFLKEKIKKAQLKLNNKTDLGSLQSKLDKRNRMSN